MKNREIEIQVKVENIIPLRQFLSKKAKYSGSNYLVDRYYTPKHRDFLKKKPVSEWLRLRESDGKSSITYKYWYYKPNGKSTHADEYESKVDDIDQLQMIFKAIDCKLICTIDKTRETYQYQDYEIALDSIKELGDFVEVEHKGNNNDDSVKITDNMISFLKDIGVGKITRNFNGYPFIKLFPKDVKYEEL